MALRIRHSHALIRVISGRVATCTTRRRRTSPEPDDPGGGDQAEPRADAASVVGGLPGDAASFSSSATGRSEVGPSGSAARRCRLPSMRLSGIGATSITVCMCRTSAHSCFGIRRTIRLVPDTSTGEERIQHALHRIALPLTLQLRGLQVLHASAVLIGDGVVALYGQSGAPAKPADSPDDRRRNVLSIFIGYFHTVDERELDRPRPGCGPRGDRVNTTKPDRHGRTRSAQAGSGHPYPTIRRLAGLARSHHSSNASRGIAYPA